MERCRRLAPMPPRPGSTPDGLAAAWPSQCPLRTHVGFAKALADVIRCAGPSGGNRPRPRCLPAVSSAGLRCLRRRGLRPDSRRGSERVWRPTTILRSVHTTPRGPISAAGYCTRHLHAIWLRRRAARAPKTCGWQGTQQGSSGWHAEADWNNGNVRSCRARTIGASGHASARKPHTDPQPRAHTVAACQAADSGRSALVVHHHSGMLTHCLYRAGAHTLLTRPARSAPHSHLPASSCCARSRHWLPVVSIDARYQPGAARQKEAGLPTTAPFRTPEVAKPTAARF